MHEHESRTDFDNDMTMLLPVFPPGEFGRPEEFSIEDTMVLAVPLGVNEHLGQGLGDAIKQVESWELRQSGTAETQLPQPVSESLGEHYSHDVKARVSQIRGSLVDLTSAQKELLDPYLSRLADEFVFSAPRALRPRLAKGETLSDWLANAGDEYIADFIDAHASVLAEQRQSEKVSKVVATLKNRLVQTIRPLVAYEIFSEDALEAIPVLQRTEFRVGDVWDTLLQGVGGYQNQGTTYAVIPQGIGKNREEAEKLQVFYAEKSVIHEGLHVPFGHFLPGIFQEAIDQHITVSIEHGGFDVIDPINRHELGIDDNSQYIALRQLLSVMESEGAVGIDVRKWTRAFTSKNRQSRDCKELDADVWRAWGVTLDDIDAYSASAGKLLEKEPAMQGKSAIEIQSEAIVMTIARLREVREEQRQLKAAHIPASATKNHHH